MMILFTEFNDVLIEDMSLYPHTYSDEALKEFKTLTSEAEKYIENPIHKTGDQVGTFNGGASSQVFSLGFC